MKNESVDLLDIVSKVVDCIVASTGCRNRDDAESAANEGLVKALAEEPDAPSALLSHRAYSRAVDALQRDRLLVCKDGPSPPDTVSNDTLDAIPAPHGESGNAGLWNHPGLTDASRRLLRLRFEEGLAWRDVGEALGVSASAAQRRFRRIREWFQDGRAAKEK